MKLGDMPAFYVWCGGFRPAFSNCVVFDCNFEKRLAKQPL